MIHIENDVIKTWKDLVSTKEKLRQGKHTCLVMSRKHPRAYEIVTILLSRDYSTIAALLSINYRTPIKKLQDSCQ